MKSLMVKGYLAYKDAAEKFKSSLSNKKGSSTVEYVIIIGVGAAVAGLLATALSKGNGEIVKTLRDKVQEVINKALTPKDG